MTFCSLAAGRDRALHATRSSLGSLPRTLLLGTILVALCVSFAQTSANASPKVREQTRTAIMEALKAQDDAWNRGDLDGYMDAYLRSPEMTFTSQGVVVKGYEALRARYQQVYGNSRQSMGTLRYDRVELTELGADYVQAVGQFILERQGQPTVDGIFTLIWARTGRGWKIMHDHSSARAVAAQKPSTPGTGDRQPAAGQKQTLPGGLVIEDTVVGTGTQANYGNTVVVHYTGWLQNGHKFDSSVDRGQPFSFVLGRGQVIPGWDRGVQGMRVGGKRRLTIPPAMGYAERGAGNVIPPNATLYFEVELIGVQ